MILDDFVMLGKTVPEANSGRQMVCTAGYSPELRQPIRVYPMARLDCPKRWSVSRVPLERNPKDSRRDSWKIRGNRSPAAHARVNRVIQPVREKIAPQEQRQIVQALMAPSIAAANRDHLSLCVLLPDDVPRIELERGEEAEMAPTPDMFGDAPELTVAQRFKWHPRIKFTDADGGKHDLMLRDWGCYEWMRKHGDDAAHQLADNLNLSSAPPLFCGNLNRFRNAWLVISVFSGTLHARPDVMDRQFAMFDQMEPA